ncbi:YcaO-like family protein [Roseovarius albus]|uniref:YcaO-like family protein n=1 Tax=Roseovarius albus TaxID=1247867 RepID=A0A1X7A8U7_9RHOB|nr:YcaO-like family protein [Roseovarius albus]SLN71793.1 YcaO-like family protein [Roseovarius albus]
MNTTLKTYTDGTHRVISPAQTVQNALPHLATMGITRVANVTGLDRIGIPVVNAIRPNSRSLSVSQGKGLSLMAAKASAIMEAIEGFHAEEIDLPLLKGSYADLVTSKRLIDTHSLAYLRGTRFDPHRSITWIKGLDLISDDDVWLPYELVHTDYTLPRSPNAGCFVASTNGLASGNHPIEAINHGICEVIERDAQTIWEHLPFDRKAETLVDLDSVTDKDCRFVIEALQTAGMSVGVWDMTGDIGVATFHCLITDARIEGGHSGGGAGTHPSRDVALLRALTEAVQVRTNYITGARDDLRHDEYEAAGVFEKNHYAQALMAALPDQLVQFENVPSQVSEALEDDLNWLLRRLVSVGVEEAVTVDLTKSEFNFPVHRVVIPGLEGPHDHDDYCPGVRARRRMDFTR